MTPMKSYLFPKEMLSLRRASLRVSDNIMLCPSSGSYCLIPKTTQPAMPSFLEATFISWTLAKPYQLWRVHQCHCVYICKSIQGLRRLGLKAQQQRYILLRVLCGGSRRLLPFHLSPLLHCSLTAEVKLLAIKVAYWSYSMLSASVKLKRSILRECWGHLEGCMVCLYILQ